MAWWKRVDDPVPFYPVEQEDGWADVAASMKADLARSKADRGVAEARRQVHGALYLHYLTDATEALDAKKYQATTAYSALAQLHLTAWQHDTPAPQTAAAPAADHEKHTQQEQT